MASIIWETGTATLVMASVLNSLTIESNAITYDIDNSVDKFLFDNVELYVTTSSGYTSFAEGDQFNLYIIREQLDGTGFEDGDASIDPPAANLVGVFVLGGYGDAQRHILRHISIPPCKFKYLLINYAQDLEPSGNTLRRLPYGYQTV